MAPGNDTAVIDAVLKACNETRALSTFIAIVHSQLARCSLRQGMRNMQQPFLSADSAHVCFGIRHIYSILHAKLVALFNSKSNAQQWLKIIENFQKKGLRAEELEMSNLYQKLLACSDEVRQFAGLELADVCQFDSLRLSVIPVVSEAKQQLHFSRAPARPLKRAKSLPRA
jgi:hypothetical protein